MSLYNKFLANIGLPNMYFIELSERAWNYYKTVLSLIV